MKGFQDFWRANLVDIFQQTTPYLAQIAYSGITDFTETIIEDLSGEILAIKVTGKGIIKGGVIEVTDTTDLLVNKVQLGVDGALTMPYTFADFLDKNLSMAGAWVLYGIKCDLVNKKGLVGITPNIRFDSEFLIHISTPSGHTTDWIVRLMAGVY